MLLSDKIFRAYDIRGKAYEDFDAEGFYCIAKAFGLYEQSKLQASKPIKFFVSGDGRQSMHDLFPAVVNGLISAGCDVVVGGEITTPMNYYAFHEGNFDASIQLSASHNPWYDNGLKLHDRSGSVCGNEIQDIKEMAQKISAEEIQLIEQENAPYTFYDNYLQKLKSIVPSQKKLKIVLDAGNGITGKWYPQIIRAFGHDVIELFCELDTRFPNHQPDPEEIENLTAAKAKVLQERADLGLVFDGDGDRVGIILADGTCLNADKINFVLAADFLGRNPGEKIIYDVMSSSVLIKKVTAIGGKPIQCPTGHSYIEEAMKEHKALLGGEQSGHFMFGENFFGHDDAALACLRFISSIESNPELILEVTNRWDQLQEFSQKFEVADEEKFKILEKVVASLLNIYPESNTADGIRIDYNDLEWAIIRCSNTSPKISMRVEALNFESLETKKEEILEIFEAIAAQKA